MNGRNRRALQSRPEQTDGHGRKDHDQIVIPPERPDEKVHEERSNHIQFAMGEVDDAHDAEDQGEPQRHQYVDERRRQAVDHNLGCEVQHSRSVLFPLNEAIIKSADLSPVTNTAI